MDFAVVIDSFQEAILMGKPRDVFAFSEQYFGDEKKPNPEEAHALHLLPFLIFNPRDFKAAACTVYCHHINADPAYRKFLDGPRVLQILKSINLPALRLKVAAVDEMAAARILALKRIDFGLFQACLRFPLACYQVVLWLQDRLLEGGQGEGRSSDGDEPTSGLGCLQQLPAHSVQLADVKKHLKLSLSDSSTAKSPTSGGAACPRSCSYHMNGVAADVEDMQSKAWLQLLLTTVNALMDGGSQVVSSSVLVDAFMRSYLARS